MENLHSKTFTNHPTSRHRTIQIRRRVMSTRHRSTILITSKFSRITCRSSLLRTIISLRRQNLLLHSLLQYKRLMHKLSMTTPITRIHRRVSLRTFTMQRAFTNTTPISRTRVSIMTTYSRLIMRSILRSIHLLSLTRPRSHITRPRILRVMFLQTTSMLTSLSIRPSHLLSSRHILRVTSMLRSNIHTSTKVRRTNRHNLSLKQVNRNTSKKNRRISRIIRLLQPTRPITQSSILRVNLLRRILRVRKLLLITSRKRNRQRTTRRRMFNPTILSITIMHLRRLSRQRKTSTSLITTTTRLNRRINKRRLQITTHRMRIRITRTRRPIRRPMRAKQLLTTRLLIQSHMLRLIRRRMMQFLTVHSAKSRVIMRNRQITMTLMRRVIRYSLSSIIIIRTLHTRVILRRIRRRVNLTTTPHTHSSLSRTITFTHSRVIRMLVPKSTRHVLQSVSYSRTTVT